MDIHRQSAAVVGKTSLGSMTVTKQDNTKQSPMEHTKGNLSHLRL